MVNRRDFLRGRIRSGVPLQRPPWALAESLFQNACTRCGDCAPVCPTGIISILKGYPELDFKLGQCTFCGNCSTACKAGALQNSDLQLWPWAIKAQVERDCLSLRGTECRICGEQCPVDAIRFSPRVGGPPVPEIDSNTCTGCGACVAPCPAKAITIA